MEEVEGGEDVLPREGVDGTATIVIEMTVREAKLREVVGEGAAGVVVMGRRAVGGEVVEGM